ncbi:MAG: hypothetical protein M5U09_08075 [Gammaproteobacteria bacterium]|nr:hypothetical protein [Gammaproteobacteria bacterium]
MTRPQPWTGLSEQEIQEFIPQGVLTGTVVAYIINIDREDRIFLPIDRDDDRPEQNMAQVQ